MARGRPPKSIRQHLLEGTFRADRHTARRAAEQKTGLQHPAATAPGSGWPWPADAPAEPAMSKNAPSQAQRILLRARPKDLSPAQKKHFRELVLGAPWLEPNDLGLLCVYVANWSIYRTAGAELDRRLTDPAFHDPKSAAAREGQAYSRILHRKAALLVQLAHVLDHLAAGERLGSGKVGFNPAEGPKTAPRHSRTHRDVSRLQPASRLKRTTARPAIDFSQRPRPAKREVTSSDVRRS